MGGTTIRINGLGLMPLGMDGGTKVYFGNNICKIVRALSVGQLSGLAKQ